MPLILVTNDDGIHSEGIRVLSEALNAIGKVVIVAPDREKSAVSHALTMHRPLLVEKMAEDTYAVNGTPTDCVVIAVEKILPGRPDIIISGINRGANMGDDITYSGTVSAAMEGTLFNIPSIAISMPYEEGKGFQFATAANFARNLAEKILENGLPADTLLNVNVPNLPESEIKGVKFTRQGKRVYDNAIHDTLDPWGRKHYWIGGGTPSWEEDDNTDFSTVSAGFVSITPLHLDLTNYDALSHLRKDWQDLTELFSETE
ncbi:MAG: 5'/3'-nucleotidase SurE [Nitrospirae bacterium]|nr:MAG: 5'/3'-nucleotidase SurE [Nitrospirota bacterium]